MTFTTEVSPKSILIEGKICIRVQQKHTTRRWMIRGWDGEPKKNPVHMLLSKKYVSNQTHVIENLTDYTRFKCKNFGLDRSSHQKKRRLSLLGIKSWIKWTSTERRRDVRSDGQSDGRMGMSGCKDEPDRRLDGRTDRWGGPWTVDRLRWQM